ncbi:MAG: hypothetical protein JNM27_15450 [Leptospirales bacterium]|nr:hypothetical protein [Leptospirales bacterium]
MKNKSTGSVARNFHEGTRSEYLAQYIFSAFGTSIPVPHPEDSGLDLFCTLGEVVGKRLFVRNPYYVQIKSGKSNMVFTDPNSIKWLYDLRSPLFLCFIDKKAHTVEIYQTHRVQHHFARKKIKSVTLRPDIEPADSTRLESNVSVLSIDLGKPILQFQVNDLLSDSWKKNAFAVLNFWIKLSQTNIDQRELGFPFMRTVKHYATNAPPGDHMIPYIGDFGDMSDQMIAKYKDNLFRLWSLLIMQTTLSGDREKFIKLSDLIGYNVKLVDDKYSAGLAFLNMAINSGAKHFGLPNKIKFTVAKGGKKSEG